MSTHRIALTLVAASAALLVAAGSASAGKEKFVRSKPHVNAGTIGHSGGQGPGASSDGQTTVIGGIGGLRQSEPPAAATRSLMIMIAPTFTTTPAK